MIGALALLLQVTAADPAVVQRARPDENTISFHAVAVPDTLSVGQQAIYQVAVFVPEEVRQRLRRNPEFVPPELRAMLAYELARGGYQLLKNRTIGRVTYEIHVFQRAIFPITAGTHTISPAELTYSLPLGSSFFSREELHTLRSEPVTIVAVAPPEARRPADWRGAVGRFAVSTRADTRTPRARDIVTVTVRVEGAGNINLLPRPLIDLSWGTVAPSSERVMLDSSSNEVHGAKEFDFLITPRDSGVAIVPAVRYSFYDPHARQYGTVEAAPETLSVGAGAPAASAGALVGRTLPPLRTTWRGERAPLLVRSPLFLAALALMPLPALFAMFRTARRRRAPRRVAGFHPPAGNATPELLRRAFRSAIEERLGFDAAAIARADDDVALVLRRYGVTAETATAVAERLAELDRAAFGGAVASSARASGLSELYDAVDREALVRGRTPRINATVPMALLLIVGSAVAAAALDADTAEQAFARGVEAWEAQRVDSAVIAFARATSLAPRSADAWANFGEASWAARDTAGAAVGWQRALRLDPLARDVRERLTLLGASYDGWVAWVPPVDANHAAWVLGASWVIGWMLLMLAATRPAAATRKRGLVLLLVSGVSAAIAVESARRAEARTLVVVHGGGSLTALPALASEASAPVAGGEVARVVESGEVWTRVELDLARSGWIATERLTPLTAQ